MATLNVTAEPGTQNIVMDVTINAPLEKVYEAYTKKDFVAQWWNQGQPMKIDYYEFGKGGKWRFITPEDGSEDAFNGCFHAIKANELLIQTFEYEGFPDEVALEKAVFERVDDTKTAIHITDTFSSVEARDGMVASGMENGFTKSIEALGALVGEEK